MKHLLGVLFVAALSGCSLIAPTTRWIPVPGVNEYANTFLDRLREAGVEGEPTPAQFKRALVDLISEYHELAVEKRMMEWESTGLTTYGGLAAVLGALADKAGLLNTGAIVAGVGLATSTQYAFGQQAAAYLNAVKKFSCISNKVASVPDAVFSEAMYSDDAHAREVAKGAIGQLILHVENIRIEAANSLMALTPSALSRDELLALLQRYSAASTARAPAPDEITERGRIAGGRILELLSDAAVCSRT